MLSQEDARVLVRRMLEDRWGDWWVERYGIFWGCWKLFGLPDVAEWDDDERTVSAMALVVHAMGATDDLRCGRIDALPDVGKILHYVPSLRGMAN